MSEVIKEAFPDTLSYDFWRLMAGDKLGRGVSREVYECKIDPSLVIKIDHGSSFANVAEWHIWQEVQHLSKDVHQWLAPCISISPCGRFLLQKRTSIPLSYPEKLPAWLCDTKLTNYGMYDGRFVCHDYALHNLIGATPRMKKVKWNGTGQST